MNANSLEAGSGGRQAWAHLLSSVPTTAQQTDGPGDPCCLARRVYTHPGMWAPRVRDGLGAPGDHQDAEPGPGALARAGLLGKPEGVLGSVVRLSPGPWSRMVLILIPGFSLTPALD